MTSEIKLTTVIKWNRLYSKLCIKHDIKRVHNCNYTVTSGRFLTINSVHATKKVVNYTQKVDSYAHKMTYITPT